MKLAVLVRSYLMTYGLKEHEEHFSTDIISCQQTVVGRSWELFFEIK